MPVNAYNQNFLETPDPVTGLQRRTGQNFLDHKHTLHERLTLEHGFDVTDSSPQIHHGIHREGSALAYVTAPGDADPTNRPTGLDKSGLEMTVDWAVALCKIGLASFFIITFFYIYLIINLLTN